MSLEPVDIKFYKDLTTPVMHQTPKVSKWRADCLKGIALFIEVPFIGSFCMQSFEIVCCAMIRFRRTGNYQGLYRLLMNCLMQNTFRKQEKYWWYLMRAAVAFTQERQHYFSVKEFSIEDTLILLGQLGPSPLKGYDVAYVFVGYSLWQFERGHTHKALKLISVAEQADPTWGYPAYLHGWYSLNDQQLAESTDYFTRAVQIDWRFLEKMTQDNICKDHPEILEIVRHRVLEARQNS